MAPAVKQSLAAQTGALSNNFKMPAVFQPPTAPMEGRVLAPYITFAHAKRADEWAKIIAKFGNIAEHDAFLVEPKSITALPTIKASVMTYYKYYARTDSVGKVLETSEKETPAVGKEHIECVLWVYLADRCTPANVQFRTTKCGGVITLSEALAEAQTPEWAAKSPQHKETLIATEPFLRFFGELQVQGPRTSKNGNVYRPCPCSAVKPTTAAEWKLVQDFFAKPDASEVIELASLRFQSQVADAKAKLPKPAAA